MLTYVCMVSVNTISLNASFSKYVRKILLKEDSLYICNIFFTSDSM